MTKKNTEKQEKEVLARGVKYYHNAYVEGYNKGYEEGHNRARDRYLKDLDYLAGRLAEYEEEEEKRRSLFVGGTMHGIWPGFNKTDTIESVTKPKPFAPDWVQKTRTRIEETLHLEDDQEEHDLCINVFEKIYDKDEPFRMVDYAGRPMILMGLSSEHPFDRVRAIFQEIKMAQPKTATDAHIWENFASTLINAIISAPEKWPIVMAWTGEHIQTFKYEVIESFEAFWAPYAYLLLGHGPAVLDHLETITNDEDSTQVHDGGFTTEEFGEFAKHIDDSLDRACGKAELSENPDVVATDGVLNVVANDILVGELKKNMKSSFDDLEKIAESFNEKLERLSKEFNIAIDKTGSSE